MENYDKYIKLHGVRIDKVTKENFLDEFFSLAKNTDPSYVVTPYSEFILAAQKDNKFKEALNSSDISIADGIYIQWAAKFMSLPVRLPSLLGKLEVLVQYFITLASIVLYPKYVQDIIPARIQGSTVIYDIAKLAADHDLKVAILGGWDFGTGNTGVLAAEKLEEKYSELNIVEIYPGNREEEEQGQPVIDALVKSKADILICCYGPQRQEKWLMNEFPKTGIGVGIGLGGTLDYVSGVKKEPPKIVRKLGLEWLFRPFISEGFSLKGMYKRAKRGWIPAMLNSSRFTLKSKLKK